MFLVHIISPLLHSQVLQESLLPGTGLRFLYSFPLSVYSFTIYASFWGLQSTHTQKKLFPITRAYLFPQYKMSFDVNFL